MNFLGLLSFFIVFLISIYWIFPFLLAWLFERKYKIPVTIGRIGLPYLKLCDIKLIKNEYIIHINEISIKSSFLNSELTKLITLVVKNVHISNSSSTALNATRQNSNLTENDSIDKVLDFRKKHVPHFINSFAQFMAVHVYEISAMLIQMDKECLLQILTKELHIDGSILKNAKSLLVTLNIMDAYVAVLKRPDKFSFHHQAFRTKLAEFSFGITLETSLVAQGPLSVEKLDVKMNHTKALIRNEFYSLLSKSETKCQDDKHRKLNTQYRNIDHVWERILPIIPRNCSLQIDDTSFKGYNEHGNIEYVSLLKSCLLNYRSLSLIDRNDILFNFNLNNFILENHIDKNIDLKSLNIDAKLKNNILNIFLQQNNLLIIYNHSIIYKWIESNFLKKDSTMASSSSSSSTLKPNPKLQHKTYFDSMSQTFLEKICKKISINFCAELSNLMAIVQLKGKCASSSLGVNKIKLMLDQTQENRGAEYKSYLADLLLKNRHWQIELLIESFWWSFKEWNHVSSKVMHLWGTPLYLGMGLIKFCTSDNDEHKLCSIFDTMQFEWSLELAEYTMLALKSLLDYQLKFKSFFNRKSTIENTNQTKKLILSVAINHFNCFLQSQNNEYFVSRLDSIGIDSNENIINFKFEELKLFTLSNSGDYYTCIRTEDILNYKIFIKIAHVDYNRNTNSVEYNISLLDECRAYWSPNFHLKALLLYRDIKEFCINFNSCLPKFKRSNISQPEPTFTTSIKCTVFGKFEFYIDINQDHTVKILLDEVMLSQNRQDHYKELFHSFKTIVIAIDDADIFEINDLTIKKLCLDNPMEIERLVTERCEAGCVEAFNNNSYKLQIDLFKAVFPPEHTYAETVHNQLFSIIKWLKLIHKTNKEEVDETEQIKPNDWLINIKEFLVEMSDDPFEVKLRDNFELLEDEYIESQKRHKMLKEKIAQLLKTHLHMQAGKVEELYANLTRKNTEIYIQRSKKMYQAAPQRTRLFAWHMTDVELIIMFESDQYSPENKICEMDPDSPWPEDEHLQFSTLWCRHISWRCDEWKFQLRDFPQPLLDIKRMYLCGQLAGAEQMSPKRATRIVTVDLGEPFDPYDIARGMQPLKFYYDLNCEIESFSYAFGPCWEPVIAQCNLSFSKISAPSRDPSPPLPFWDKMRLLLHGRFTTVVQHFQVLLHASLDPYNTTEEMALTWEKVIMDWTNGKLVFKGDLNIFVHTASKYDDVQLLKLPNLKLLLGFHWVCLGDPNDHHNVIYCAPDKIPEYSSNQVHDSFRAFRSQNLNLSIVLETKPLANQSVTSCPILLLYGSTLRWIENLKLILSGVTRPTRRGKIFNNVRPRKIQLSRHYKKLNLLVGLHKFQVCYWMSFAMHRGCELFGGRISSSSEHSLALVSIDDGLKHRPKAEWSIVYMNSELADSEIWLKSAIQQDELEIESSSRSQPVEKTYCLSVAKVSYGRETVLTNQSISNRDTPTHRLVVYDLRGAWTKSNRNVAFALFDTFMKTKRTKKNLSTEALKAFRKDTNNTTPLKQRRSTEQSSGTPTTGTSSVSVSQDAPSPITKLEFGHAANMLQQLIAEADKNSIVYSDDLSAVSRKQHLQGVQACQEDDVLHKNWQISLVNAQVLLKGCETNGYVILSAAKSEIIQRIHRPTWKDRALVTKTTWSGLLECMQYYATVNAGENDANENIMWLTIDNIQEKESAEISEPSEVPNMVGSGVSVGAVVTDTVGPSSSRQLQRIVSRCKCEFYYAGYGDISVDLEGVGDIPPPPQEDVSPWDYRQSAADAFTLMHYDLDVCTNSLQYAMLLDIINNLLLYVEPHRKEALAKLSRMRLQLLLHSVEDQRRPIQEKQTVVRNMINKLRRLEKDTYLLNKAIEETPEDLDKLRQELDRLEKLMYDCKLNLNAQSEELDMMVSCYKETQLLASARLATTRNDKPLTVVRANEICFKHAQWRLTEADGQIGIADLVLSNFLYTKNSKSDDSVEHLLELGYLRMTNLLPNEIYKEILCPTEILFDMPIEHKKVLRIFCREKPPVGGISVKEHFEINLVPLTIGLTKKFYNTMMKFSFPERDPEEQDRTTEELEQEVGTSSSSTTSIKASKKGKSKKIRDSSFYVHIDDVDKMKERAEKNKLFVYIKIPEVPVKVSYKGSKEKNLEDLRDVSIVIPTLEYHNMTWTWLDLLMAIRNDTKKVILSQAIKQKLQLKRNTGTGEDNTAPHEEDKAKMLLGSRHAPENRSIRKGVFRLGKQ